nr:hypothetical protein [Nitrospira sp.]
MACVKKSVGQEAETITLAGAGLAVHGGASRPQKRGHSSRSRRLIFTAVAAIVLFGALAWPAYSQTGSQLGPLPPKLPQLPVVPPPAQPPALDLPSPRPPSA